MENINTDCVNIKNTDIFNFWLQNNRNATTVVNWIFTKFNRSVDEECMATIKKKIYNFCAYANQKWNKNHRCAKRFEKYESLWLSNETEFKFSESDVGKKRGRPHVGYSEGSARQKRKLASEISSVQGHDTNLLVHAASIAAHASKANDLNFVLKEVASSPSRATEIRQVVTCHEKKPLPLSPEEALLFLIENNLTKQQYINIREMSKSRNCDIYPHYQKIRECKLQCRPEGLMVSESSAQIPLQSLVNHTAKIILSYQEEVLVQIPELNEVTLVLSYGFDGSTGQSSFKQIFSTNAPESLDNSLFVTSVIPLKIITSHYATVWINRTPQSVRFCRPLKIEFIKETKEHILKEKNNLDVQIKNLEPLEYFLVNGRKILVKFELIMTLIDGKVLNVLTETKSSQSCPICGGNPKQFLSINDLSSLVFQPKPNSLKYGISPLYFQKYKWYPMSATLHKILAHSSQIIQASIVPLGCAGENASEVRNKFYKKDRIEHARKDSREHNISDVFNRAMDSSDPFLSSICIKNRHSAKKSLQLPREVISLLKIPDIPEYQLPTTSRAITNEALSDFEEETDVLPNVNIELEVDETLDNFDWD